jgi:hypothetical protein
MYRHVAYNKLQIGADCTRMAERGALFSVNHRETDSAVFA